MSELAAHLIDHVLPHVPIRQWVFTVPVSVRYQLAFDAALTRAVLRVFLSTVFAWQHRRAIRRGLVDTRSGSVTAIQRFGGSANLNIHFHALLFDGRLHARDADQPAPVPPAIRGRTPLPSSGWRHRSTSARPTSSRGRSRGPVPSAPPS